MSTVQGNPKIHEGHDRRVSVKVHPYTPLPPPAETQSSLDSSVDRSRLNGNICAVFLICFVYIPLFFTLIYIDKGYPGFKLESVSVSIDDHLVYSSGDAQLATAEWKLGFTVRNPNRHSNFDFTDINVFVKCMSQDWSGAVVSPFIQGPKNTTSINATVKALLPHRLVRAGLVLDFEVMFRARFKGYRVQALCDDIKVGFSRNGTIGNLVGRQKLCPLEFKDIDFVDDDD